MDHATQFPDAHAPREIARKVQNIGVTKAQTDTLTLTALSVLAGAFVSFGALLYTVAITDSRLGFGPTRLLGGFAFCLGLVLVVIAGAELFTGNNLLAMAWASRLIRTRDVLRNWLIVYVGNVVGCLGTVAFVLLANTASMGDGAVAATALKVAHGKVSLSFGEPFVRGILCNALVCLAVWLVMGGRSVTDKIVGVIFPTAAFVALGFEHCIANWFFLPFGMALDTQGTLSIAGVARNLVAVTAGNIVGGTLLVAGVYWVAYLRSENKREANTSKGPGRHELGS